ncbi:MAG: hypothetical protein KKH98_11115 [Spirochaetes bacterium]|nr:hypothetical protein [Spirochaetota bacterium]
MINLKYLVTFILLFLIIAVPGYTQEIKAVPAEKEGNIFNDGKSDYATSKATFTLVSEDKLSLVKSILVKIDKSEFVEYTKPITLDQEGFHTIIYYSIDNVENRSKETAYTVIIDNTPPEVKLDSSIKLVTHNDKQYASGITEFSLSATDKSCGVKTIEYSEDSGAYKPYNEKIVFKKSGLHTIKYRAVDNLGNISAEQSFSVNIDNAKPIVKIIPSGKLFEAKGVNYVPADFKYSIEAVSMESAVSTVFYAVDSDKYTDYKTPFTLPGEGIHTIKVKAVDIVGNESDIQTLAVTVDATPPTTKLIPNAK